LEKNSTAVWVAAVALLRDDDKALLQKRHFEAVHGDLWEFPGGKIEWDEDAGQAAVREIDEELGLTIAPGDLVPVTFATQSPNPASGEQTLTILLFACRRWSGEPEARWAGQVDWFGLDDLSSLPMPPLDRPLSRRLAEMVRHKMI